MKRILALLLSLLLLVPALTACGGGNKPEEEQISIGEETPDGGLLEQDGTKAI